MKDVILESKEICFFEEAKCKRIRECGGKSSAKNYRVVVSNIKHDSNNFQSRNKILQFSFFFISINQIDTCHTTNISKGGWFIRLFKKHLQLIKKKSHKINL